MKRILCICIIPVLLFSACGKRMDKGASQPDITLTASMNPTDNFETAPQTETDNILAYEEVTTVTVDTLLLETDDWDVFYDYRGEEHIVQVTLSIPENWVFSRNVLYTQPDYEGKIGEVNAVISLKPGQTLLDTWEFNKGGTEEGTLLTRQSVTIGDMNGQLVVVQSEAGGMNGSTVYYTHRYYLIREALVCLITFYSRDNSDDDRMLFEKLLSTVSIDEAAVMD